MVKSMKLEPLFAFHGGSKPANGVWSILMVEIDNLLPLEKLFGEQITTDILKVVEHRLTEVTPVAGLIWKPGSRSFAIAVPEMFEDGALSFARSLQAEIAREHIETSGGPVAVTISVGHATGVDLPPEELASAANDALSEASAVGVGSVRGAKQDDRIAEHRLKLLSVAQITMRALGAGQLSVAYQPVVRAQGAQTVAFYECLARIVMDDGSLLSAAEFMPSVEQLGLATIVDRQVLGQALEMLEQYPNTRLSINLFPQTMQDAEWMSMFRNAIRANPSIAERLIVEMTETGAVLDVTRTRTFIDSLREVGVAFALDDFGAGHTSFGHLRDFRFDMIKIDQAFIKGIASDPDSRFFVRTLLTIADRFEMMTVAEAVQSAAEAKILADMGVGYFQGFFFGSPSLKLEPMEEPEHGLLQRV